MSYLFFFFKQKTAYEMRISDWSSDVCSSDLGLVGRIYEAGPNTANVLLLTDPENIVPVRRTRDNVAGISTGRGDGSLEVRPLSTGRNPFKPGDIMVTSGTGGL